MSLPVFPVTSWSDTHRLKQCCRVLRAQVREMAAAVSEPTLRGLTTLLLVRLLDEGVLVIQEGGQLVRAINVLMLKVRVLACNRLLFQCSGCCLSGSTLDSFVWDI